MPFRRKRLIQAAAAGALPGLLALAGLLAAGEIGGGAFAIGIAATAALAIGLALPLVIDIGVLAHRLEAILADDTERVPHAWRTPFGGDLALALIRARRRIGAARRAQEARTVGAEAVIDCLPEPLLVLDPRRRVVRANLAAETLLAPRLVGRDLAEVLRHPGVLSGAAETLADGRGRAVDLRLPAPVERHLRARIAALPRPGRAGGAAVLILEDQTSVRRSEQMRVDFVANVSHELRTPLATLTGFIETLQGAARDDAEARERFLVIMHGEAARMRRIVDDLLSLSRIELEEHNPPTGAVALGDVLRGVAAALEMMAAGRGTSIALDCPPDLPPVRGDADQLAQVFRNLVENAIKYGRPRTPVEVSARAAEGTVAVTVRDHGPGIPREHLPRLTERFYRADPARSRGLGGTGLGLAIVKHIVSRHRGRLAIDSAEGEGSRFTVVLPAAQVS